MSENFNDSEQWAKCLIISEYHILHPNPDPHI